MSKKFIFTDAKIKAIQPGKKRIEYYDEKVTGMILRVTKSGHKSFAYRYWFHEKSKQITIGKFGDISLGRARNICRDYKEKVRTGTDPLAEVKKKKETPDQTTFLEFSKIYDSLHMPTLRQSSQDYHKWLIVKKILPYLGKRNMMEITASEILKILDRIAIQDGAPATANKTRSRLHHMFNFAIRRGYANHNPVSKTTTYKAGNVSRERYYKPDELKKIWLAYEQLPEPVQSYLKIVTLTGQRRTETHMMKWENIQNFNDSNFKGWVWIIPADRAKSGRNHEVQLSAAALEILRNLQERAGKNPFVFASGAADDIPIGLKTIKRAVQIVKKTTGITDFRLHDLRRTVATYLAELKTSADVVSKILNHSTGGGGSLVTRIYNRYEYRAERAAALNKWAHELARIVNSETNQEQTNIKIIGLQ